MILSEPTGSRQNIAAVLLLAGTVATVGTALGFEHLGGYIPCALCLEQRIPYYLAIPVAALAAISAILNGPAIGTRLLLLATAGLMLWGLYLGAFHSGVEWGGWAGPADCGAVAAPAAIGSAGVLDQLNSVIPPSCDKAAGRFLGLSFAGWNVVASLVLAAIALRGAFSRA